MHIILFLRSVHYNHNNNNDTRTSKSTTPTFITEALHLVTSLQLFFNDCYSELTAYTALAYSYWASFHDEYIFLCHAHALLIPTTTAM